MSALSKRIVVTTAPFGVHDRTPLDLAAAAGIELAFNPLDRRLQPSEVLGVIKGFPVVVAGTEPITAEVMAACPELRAICRVGIGLDSVDLMAARQRGIAVSYTPDGPSAAVGELTIGLMIDLLRGVNPADRGMRTGKWIRHTGLRLANATIGILGVGRIGRRVIRHLQGGFAGVRIVANDLVPDRTLTGVEWLDKEAIYRHSDIISVHVPLTAETENLIGARELALMKRSAVLVNTARGGIVNELDLAHALSDGTIRGAAIDVFCDEPYQGTLAELPNALLTCHMGSMTVDCRAQMEIEATREAIRFLTGQKLLSPVPDDEYAIAERRARV